MKAQASLLRHRRQEMKARHAEARRETSHDASHDRWLVSYADFITLLFAFFTVMYATSQQDTVKEKQFENSMRKSFAILSKTLGQAGKTSEEVGGDEQSANQSQFAATDQILSAQAGPVEMQDHVLRKLHENLKSSDYQQMINSVRHDALGVHIELASGALFSPGSADLRPEAWESLSKISNVLRSTNRKLIIEGHTDSEPIHTHRFPSNWELSAARATKIVRYLNQIQHIEKTQLAAVAYADTKPLDSADTDTARSRNRRIEILIVR